MKEIKNNEIVTEETEVIAVPEEQTESKVKKVWKVVKKNAPKALAVGAALVGGFLLGAHVSGKSEEIGTSEGFDVIEADDFTVEDAE